MIFRQFFVNLFIALTINIDLECLIGDRRDSVVGYAAIHAHMYTIDFGDVQRVSSHRCRFPRSIGDCLFVFTHPFNGRLWESIRRTSQSEMVAFSDDYRSGLVRSIFSSWRKGDMMKVYIRKRFGNLLAIDGAINMSFENVPLTLTFQRLIPGIPWLPSFPLFPVRPLGPVKPFPNEIRADWNIHCSLFLSTGKSIILKVFEQFSGR